jgi:hypothetical protein
MKTFQVTKIWKVSRDDMEKKHGTIRYSNL